MLFIVLWGLAVTLKEKSRRKNIFFIKPLYLGSLTSFLIECGKVYHMKYETTYESQLGK